MKFSGVYYTNIPRSTYRNFFQSYQLATLAFHNVTRLDGPDGSAYESKDELIDDAVKEFPHFEVYRTISQQQHSINSVGVIACHWGFHRLFLRLQEDLDNEECVLYCHDDIHIRKPCYFWEDLCAQAPFFNIVQLISWDHYLAGLDDPLQKDNKPRDLTSIGGLCRGINRYGDGALLLTKDGAKMLQDLSIKYFAWPMDILIKRHSDELTDIYHIEAPWTWVGISYDKKWHSEIRFANENTK